MKRIAVVFAALLLLGAAAEAVVLLNDGIRAAKRGDLKGAEQLISRAIAIDPREAPDYPVHFWHGVVFSGLGDDAAAQKEWKESERQHSQDAELRRRLAAPQVATPLQRAAAARSDALFLDARLTKSFRTGEAAMKAGKYDEALASYRRSLTESRLQMFTLALPRPPIVPMPQPQPVQTETLAIETSGTGMIVGTGGTTTEAVTTAPPPTTTTGTTATTATTGTTATSSTPDVFEEIKRRFKGLSPGTVAFNAPDRMKVAETETVTVRIAPKGEAGGITANLAGQTTTASQEEITPTMGARLDGVGFQVKPLTPETQLVAGGGFAEWRWEVTATDTGDRDLNLSIIAKLDQDERVVGTQTHRVHVDSDPIGAVKGFLAENWQWLASAIVIPLIALLYRSRAKRKEGAS